MALLRVEDLTIRPPKRQRWLQYRRAERKPLDAISFELEAGTITGMVGEEGSGKLALALAILGVEKVTSGSVFFDDGEESILRFSRRRWRPIRRQIQLLLHDECQPLNPRRSIGEQMHQALRLHLPELTRGERDQRSVESLEAAGLSSAMLARLPSQMISAHRQRCAIAKALCVEPRLLICHDLTSGADMTVQAEILNLLKDLRDQRGLALLFITHDLAVADHMSDRILILNRGRIVESGTPSDIVENPEHDYTRRLVASTTSLH